MGGHGDVFDWLQESLSNFVRQMDRMRRTGFVSQLFCQLLEENLGLMKDAEDRDEALGKLYETNDQLKREIVALRGTLPPRKPSCSRRRAQPGDSLEPVPKKARPSCAPGEDKPEETGEDEQVPIEEKAWVANSNKVRAIGKELVSQANELKRRQRVTDVERKLDQYFGSLDSIGD